MPEIHFNVRWPDGTVQRCYSPSRSVKHYLQAGASYPLDDFLGRTRSGLELAGERVRLRHGFRCSSAAEQIEQIERTAQGFGEDDDALVTIVSFDE